MQTIKLKWGFMRFSILLGIVFLTGGCAPIFDYHYFYSDTEGVVSMDGEPVSGVKVTRMYKSDWYWYLNDTLETAITDDKGYFHFSHARKYTTFVFIHQPVVHKKLNFEYQGQQYLGWKYTSLNYDQDGEIGRPIKLECDLSVKESSHRFLIKNSYRDYDGLCEISGKY